MDKERIEGQEPKPRYKVVSPSFDELVRQSQHWDRVFPEAAQWRREESHRARLEASGPNELFEMSVRITQQEWELFPEAGNRIIGDAKDDLVEDFVSRNRLRYLFLFGILNPNCVIRNKEASVKIWIDWEKAPDISS